MSEPEIPLLGGDVTEGVVRVGNTVRRPIGDHSRLVHHALRHLEGAGFDGAPRFLGVDEQGREILTFLPGEVAGRPWPAWVAHDERAISTARLLRRLDDAMAPLGLPAGSSATPPSWPGVPSPPGPAASFLGHRDVTPENTVFAGTEAVALIDFDLMRASSPVDEVANLLLWWGGWMPPADREPVMRELDPSARGRLLVDAYGLSDALRPWVVPVAIWSTQAAWHSMRARAVTLGGGWARMWSQGVGDRIRRREQWLRDNESRLSRAVLG